jgi:hypothetical protein
MWRLWSWGLETLGRLRFRLPFRWRKALRVGDPAAPDSRGGHGWRDYLDAERLYDVWGPVPDGLWIPFHCVPLFAALDSIRRGEIGPTRPAERREAANGASDAGRTPGPVQTKPAAAAPLAPPDGQSVTGLNLRGATGVTPPAAAERRELPAAARPGAPAPSWLKGDTWTILDLPGPMAVEAAAWLVGTGCQPVCTFDNWPHPRGVLRAEATLAELLRWATTVADARPRLHSGSPPLWICDSDRLGTRQPGPGEFDNRYYLDDSSLPGPAILRRAGIRKVVYVTAGGSDIPLLDLDAYFRELLAAGVPVLHADLSTADREPSAIQLSQTPRRPRASEFRRSAAGGFGTAVPDPSSGGSGG